VQESRGPVEGKGRVEFSQRLVWRKEEERKAAKKSRERETGPKKKKPGGWGKGTEKKKNSLVLPGAP